MDNVEATPKAKPSWRTTVLGIASIIAAFGSVWAPPEYQSKIQASAVIAAGLAHTMAKDSAAE